ALVFFDAIRGKVRDEGMVRNKAVYVALGVRPDGTKEILGLWIEQTEGAKFWLRVMNELKNRGVEDVLIAVVDGLKGFPETITAVFPQTQVQTCIVHLIRNSLDFVSYKDRKAFAAALKQIYRAKDAAAGEEEVNAFAEGPWGRKYPAIAQSWRRHWSEVIPFYAFPDEVRQAEPGRELSTGFKLLRISDGRDYRACRNRSKARDTLQAPGGQGLVVAVDVGQVQTLQLSVQS